MAKARSDDLDVNIFDPASHDDPTLLPKCRELVKQGDSTPFLAPIPALGIGEQEYRVILDAALARAILTDQQVGVGVLDPRTAPMMEAVKVAYPWLWKLTPYHVFILPEGEPHLAVRSIFSHALTAATTPHHGSIASLQEETAVWAKGLAASPGETVNLVAQCNELVGKVLLRLCGFSGGKGPLLQHARALGYLADFRPSPAQYRQADDSIRVLWEAFLPMVEEESVRAGILSFCFRDQHSFSPERILTLALWLLLLSLENTAGTLYRLIVRFLRTPAQLTVFQTDPNKYATRAIQAGLWADAAVWYILRHVGEAAYRSREFTFPSWSHIVILPGVLQHLEKDPVFDIEKYGKAEVFSFGIGSSVHHCIGEPLARLILRTALLAIESEGLWNRLQLTDRIVPYGSSFFMTPLSHEVCILPTECAQ